MANERQRKLLQNKLDALQARDESIRAVKSHGLLLTPPVLAAARPISGQ